MYLHLSNNSQLSISLCQATQYRSFPRTYTRTPYYKDPLKAFFDIISSIGINHKNSRWTCDQVSFLIHFKYSTLLSTNIDKSCGFLKRSPSHALWLHPLTFSTSTIIPPNYAIIFANHKDSIHLCPYPFSNNAVLHFQFALQYEWFPLEHLK